jgi:hypothetical protein
MQIKEQSCLLRKAEARRQAGDISNTTLHVLRHLPADDPRKFPEPAVYLSARMPLWTAQSILDWIARQVERGQAQAVPHPVKRGGDLGNMRNHRAVGGVLAA